MSLQQLFHYFSKKRKWLLILFILIFVCSIPFIIFHQKEQYKTYIFFTVAPKEYVFKEDNQQSINSFYLISASDIFAETIVGWFKNPGFIQDIENACCKDVEKKSLYQLPALNARKETKQNVMIFFTTNAKEKNETIATSVLDTTAKYIFNYNEKTNTSFQLANISKTTFTLSPNVLLDGIVSMIVSFISALIILLIPLLTRKDSV